MEKNVIDFKKLVQELEDKKWEILLTKGDLAASREWPAIEEKLNRLYRWWAKDYGCEIRTFVPRKFR